MSSPNASGENTRNIAEDVSTRTLFSVRVGESAGKLASGSNNTFVGYEAGKQTKGGSENTFIGCGSGSNHQNASRSTFVGAYAGANNTRGDETTLIGFQAGEYNLDGMQCVGVGAYALRENATGNRIVAIGYRAGERTLNGDNNTLVGSEAGQNNRSGSFNTMTGFQAGRAAFRGDKNTYVGAYAGYSNGFGHGNAFVGFACGEQLNNGHFNVGIGAFALQYCTNGSCNIAIGAGAGARTINGDGSVVIGKGSGANNANGSFNVLLGTEAASNMQGSQSVVVGYQSGWNLAGSNNVLVGCETLKTTGAATGNHNVLVGAGIGNLLVECDHSVMVGNGCGAFSNVLRNAIVIANRDTLAFDNTVIIGDNNETKKGSNIFVGFDLSADSENSVILGNQINISSVILFKDPLSYSTCNLARLDSQRFGISNIDYSTMLVNAAGEPNLDATAYASNVEIENSVTTPIALYVPASYRLTDAWMLGAADRRYGYALFQGLSVFQSNNTPILFSSNTIKSLITLCNVDLNASFTVPAAADASHVSYSIPIGFSNTSTPPSHPNPIVMNNYMDSNTFDRGIHFPIEIGRKINLPYYTDMGQNIHYSSTTSNFLDFIYDPYLIPSSNLFSNAYMTFTTDYMDVSGKLSSIVTHPPQGAYFMTDVNEETRVFVNANTPTSTSIPIQLWASPESMFDTQKQWTTELNYSVLDRYGFPSCNAQTISLDVGIASQPIHLTQSEILLKDTLPLTSNLWFMHPADPSVPWTIASMDPNMSIQYGSTTYTCNDAPALNFTYKDVLDEKIKLTKSHPSSNLTLPFRVQYNAPSSSYIHLSIKSPEFAETIVYPEFTSSLVLPGNANNAHILLPQSCNVKPHSLQHVPAFNPLKYTNNEYTIDVHPFPHYATSNVIDTFSYLSNHSIYTQSISYDSNVTINDIYMFVPYDTRSWNFTLSSYDFFDSTATNDYQLHSPAWTYNDAAVTLETPMGTGTWNQSSVQAGNVRLSFQFENNIFSAGNGFQRDMVLPILRTWDQQLFHMNIHWLSSNIINPNLQIYPKIEYVSTQDHLISLNTPLILNPNTSDFQIIRYDTIYILHHSNCFVRGPLPSMETRRALPFSSETNWDSFGKYYMQMHPQAGDASMTLTYLRTTHPSIPTYSTPPITFQFKRLPTPSGYPMLFNYGFGYKKTLFAPSTTLMPYSSIYNNRCNEIRYTWTPATKPQSFDILKWNSRFTQCNILTDAGFTHWDLMNQSIELVPKSFGGEIHETIPFKMSYPLFDSTKGENYTRTDTVDYPMTVAFYESHSIPILNNATLEIFRLGSNSAAASNVLQWDQKREWQSNISNYYYYGKRFYGRRLQLHMETTTVSNGFLYEKNRENKYNMITSATFSNLDIPSYHYHWIQSPTMPAAASSAAGRALNARFIYDQSITSLPFQIHVQETHAHYPALLIDPLQTCNLSRTLSTSMMDITFRGGNPNRYQWAHATQVYDYAGGMPSFPLSLLDENSNLIWSGGMTVTPVYRSMFPAFSQWNVALDVEQANQVSLTRLINDLGITNVTDIHNVCFYVKDPPSRGFILTRTGGTPKPAFTLEDLNNNTIIYQHDGTHDVTHDAFTLYYGSSPYDVGLGLGQAVIHVSLTVHLLPWVTQNIQNYIFSSDPNLSDVPFSGMHQTLALSSYGKLWNDVSLNPYLSFQTNTITSNILHQAIYKIHPSYFNGRLGGTTVPNEPITTYFIPMSDIPVAANPNLLFGMAKEYARAFYVPWTTYLNTYQVVKHIVAPQARWIAYDFDASLTDGTFQYTSDINQRAIGIGLQFRPIYPVASSQLQGTYRFKLSLLDAHDISMIQFQIQKDVLHITLEGHPTFTIPMLGVMWSEWNSWLFVSRDDYYMNPYPSIYYNYNTNLPLRKNLARNVLSAANTTADPNVIQELISALTQINYARIRHVRVDIDEAHVENILNQRGGDAYATYTFVNVPVRMEFKDMTLYATTNQNKSTVVQNVVVGKTIDIQGTDNICIGKNFRTTGNKSIIIGNDIGNASDDDATLLNDIFQSIIIGNSSFQKTTIRNMIAIGSRIFNDLSSQTDAEIKTALNTFVANNPILVANDVNSNYLAYHINFGNSVLGTRVNGPKLILGLENEKVMVGHNVNITTAPSDPVLNVQGDIRVEGTCLWMYSMSNILPGRVVCATGTFKNNHLDDPWVEECAATYDPTAVGVVKSCTWDATSNVYNVYTAVSGKGPIWVKGNVSAGQYLTTSALKGFAEWQSATNSSNVRCNFTVAKALSSTSMAWETSNVLGSNVYKIPCLYSLS